MDLRKAKRILIVRLSSLGDIILSTPLIRSLKKYYPEIEIDYVLRKEYKDVLAFNPYIEGLFYYERDEESNEGLKENLLKRNYNIIIDLQNNLRSSRLLKGSKGEILRFNKKSLAKFLLVNFKINMLKDAPSIPVRYAGAVGKFNLDEEGLDLFSPKEASPKISSDVKYIGLAPGSRHFTKRWPEDYYIRLGELINDSGKRCILFGGKDDKEICSLIGSMIKDSINLCNDNDILQTSADMKQCQAVVCSDSGLMHAACASKIPVLVFFGSTVKEFGFYPYHTKNLILENKLLSCRPCSHIGRSRCPKGHFKCMLEITPEEAFKNLTLLLS